MIPLVFFVVVCACVVAIGLHNAREGYEDQTGFHYGKPEEGS